MDYLLFLLVDFIMLFDYFMTWDTILHGSGIWLGLWDLDNYFYLVCFS